MNILLLTSAMSESQFTLFYNKALIKPGYTNQSFFSKFIKSLSINNNVAVVSARKLQKGQIKENYLEAQEFENGNTKYFSTYVEPGHRFKTFREPKEIMKMAKRAIDSFLSDEFIIVTETLSYNLLKCALKLGALYKKKVVGVLTGSPFHVPDIKKDNAAALVSQIYKCDAFISLKRNLVDQIDPDAEAYVFDGLVEEQTQVKKEPLSGYFFFNGYLSDHFGIKRFVDAFHQSECKSKLIIAGNGPLAKYIDKLSKEDYRILFLSQISKEKVLSYSLNSIANINPGSLDSRLEKDISPFELVEYLSLGIPVISTKSPRFYRVFKNDVTWIEDDTLTTMAYTLEDFEKSDLSEAKRKALTARAKAFEFYGLDVQCEGLTHFLNKIK